MHGKNNLNPLKAAAPAARRWPTSTVATSSMKDGELLGAPLGPNGSTR